MKPKNNSQKERYGIHISLLNPSEYYVYPNGIYFFKFVNAPWTVKFSRSANRKYFFNCKTNESTYYAPSDNNFCATPK